MTEQERNEAFAEELRDFLQSLVDGRPFEDEPEEKGEKEN